MALRMLYLVFLRLLGLLLLLSRSQQTKDAELLALRHENAVLRRRLGVRPGSRNPHGPAARRSPRNSPP